MEMTEEVMKSVESRLWLFMEICIPRQRTTEFLPLSYYLWLFSCITNYPKLSSLGQQPLWYISLMFCRSQHWARLSWAVFLHVVLPGDTWYWSYSCAVLDVFVHRPGVLAGHLKGGAQSRSLQMVFWAGWLDFFHGSSRVPRTINEAVSCFKSYLGADLGTLA